MKKAEQKELKLQLKLAEEKGKSENRELLKLCVKKGAEVLKWAMVLFL